MALSRDPPVHHLEADEFPRNTFLFLPRQDLVAKEIAFVELDHPTQVSFEYGVLFVDVVSIERHFCFEPQRVASPQAGRL